MSKCFKFFATSEDMINAFENVKSKNDIKFTRARNYDYNELFDVFLHVSDIPRLGTLSSDSHCIVNYIVTKRNINLCANEYTDYSGRKMKDLSQKLNPDSIVFSPSGVYEDNKCIIHGQLGTIHDNKESLSLFTTVCHGLKKQFINFHGWFIGPEALSLYGKVRFIIISINEPCDYDFKI